MTGKTKTGYTLHFNEPDEFWFGDGYWQIYDHSGLGYLVTDDKKLAEKVFKLLSEDSKGINYEEIEEKIFAEEAERNFKRSALETNKHSKQR